MFHVISIFIVLGVDSYILLSDQAAVIKELKFGRVMIRSFRLALANLIMTFIGYLITLILAFLSPSINQAIANILLLFLASITIFKGISQKKTVERLRNFSVIDDLYNGLTTGFDSLIIAICLIILGINPYFVLLISFLVSIVVAIVAQYVGFYYGSENKRLIQISSAIILIGYSLLLIFQGIQ